MTSYFLPFLSLLHHLLVCFIFFALFTSWHSTSVLFSSLCFSFFFFFFKNIYFNLRLIILKYCGVFAIHWHESQLYMVPPYQNPSHFLPHPIPLGCPSALALSALFHASNLDCSSISHMVIYMFNAIFSKLKRREHFSPK